MEDLEYKLNSLPKGVRDNVDSESLERQKKSLEAKRYSSDTEDRKWLAIWTAIVVSLWLIGVMRILMLNKECEMGLSDNVLIALLGTTTFNVLGLSFIVLRGHFDSSKK